VPAMCLKIMDLPLPSHLESREKGQTQQ